MIDDWWSRAACAGAPNPRLWFPDRDTSTTAAKAICGVCPVVDACLDYALVNGERYGIWGGLSERQRKRIRRRDRVAA